MNLARYPAVSRGYGTEAGGYRTNRADWRLIRLRGQEGPVSCGSSMMIFA
ncbi:hypothetical protein [Paenibacillus dendritiformis]|nr:hypothetical protein [Paenibacillus dendritiformis]CAH8769644.1 hypothetical protein H7S4_002375 [Paenibacillus dendritiformis]